MDFRICQREAYDERLHVRKEYTILYLLIDLLLSSAMFTNLAYNNFDEGMSYWRILIRVPHAIHKE